MECKHENLAVLRSMGIDGPVAHNVFELQPNGCDGMSLCQTMQVRKLCVCKDCGAVFVKEFMSEVAESESEKTGEKMLKKLGYERKQDTAPEVYVSRGSEGLDYIIRVDGDLCWAEYKADGQVAETSLTADEVHALHYLFKERGL